MHGGFLARGGSGNDTYLVDNASDRIRGEGVKTVQGHGAGLGDVDTGLAFRAFSGNCGGGKQGAEEEAGR